MSVDISSSNDPYRLPRHVMPTRYDLRLEPDLTGATFTGRVTITIMVKQMTQTILLNAVDLALQSAVVERPNRQPFNASIELEQKTQRAKLSFQEAIDPGEWKLAISFEGALNDQLRGFYRSTYKDASGTTQTLAATQFEATDARRAFPCWDEPDFKAVFAATLAIDPHLTAVSNTAVVSESMEIDKKIVRFADSIIMSTYLVAFIVGRIEATTPVYVGKTPLRLWTIPGKQPLTPFGQDIAAASLKFFEDYYGVPYPGDKLDLLAIPDFASGAMENLGAITFRETALLVDERTGTHAELERVADVVAHENAHMWFGDLVTMSWWNGLWLNEAFATFMEMLAVDAWRPEWKRWESFSVARAAAFSVDGLMSTRPIEFPVHAPKDADAMFDILTYEKGASVLRMLEQHIGPIVFRDGVRQYLRTHAYGNADTKDLWTALGSVGHQPVPELMNGWIFQPGFPLITADLQGQELRLSQQRFTYLAPEPASERLWQVPIQVRLTVGDRTEHRKLLLAEREASIDLPAGVTSVFVNEGGHGFYRVRHQGLLLKQLLEQGLEHLAVIERFALVSDAWAATMAGLTPLPEYLRLTRHFTNDRDKNVWAVLLDSFSFLNKIISPEDRSTLETFVRGCIQPAINELGWNAMPGESDLLRQLRGDLLGAIGKLGNDAATQQDAADRYHRYRKDPTTVDPNIVPALVAILAHTGDEARYDEFSERYRTASTPQEERRYLFSLAVFALPSLARRTLERTTNGEIRTQDAPFVVGALLTNVYSRDVAWEFVKTNWDRMDRLFPKQGLRRMCGGIAGLATPELERDVRSFFASRKIDLGGKTLEQYLEQLRIAVSFREREGRTMRTALASSLQE
ncbi:M1 family metallopeptidase [Candidatus Nitrospira nitrificans]|uniref:Aminopeptidase n=1 Tax=Candidatus Nitrospira nitrificans TaxID=1742973 RepID=A0A0S4LFA8_9BACT|nr:M1 family metallopeptidase [Candidatus Nitrospira nitrificans]CUS34630.1 putative Peptidase M1, membrane alanine aminopeptidase [Candidatus Nitrospira nitrificans]